MVAALTFLSMGGDWSALTDQIGKTEHQFTERIKNLVATKQSDVNNK
jgi:hypothetical protein